VPSRLGRTVSSRCLRTVATDPPEDEHPDDDRLKVRARPKPLLTLTFEKVCAVYDRLTDIQAQITAARLENQELQATVCSLTRNMDRLYDQSACAW
jgi:hypothetical protein